ncbi:hypothetical protein BJV77DRAFT_964212 [Russula vinacea]|nr:hypothetical protein BJV77DRAFT_964212 [Russula vinacea]
MPQRTVKERARRKSMVTPRPEHAPFEDRLPGCHSQRDFWRSLDGFSSGDWSLENVPRDSRHAPTRTLLGHSLRRSLLYCVQRFPERTGSALDAARIPFPEAAAFFRISTGSTVALRHHQERTRSFSDWATYGTGVLGAEEALLWVSAGLSHRSVIAVKRSSGTREGRASANETGIVVVRYRWSLDRRLGSNGDLI